LVRGKREALGLTGELVRGGRGVDAVGYCVGLGRRALCSRLVRHSRLGLFVVGVCVGGRGG